MQANKKLLFHSRAGLEIRLSEELVKENPNTSLIEAVEILIQFIVDDYHETFQEFELLTSLNQITYNLLWVLFAPNTLVYRYHDLTEQSQVLICRSISYENGRDGPFVMLSCDFITNDGSALGFARDYLQIKTFPGTFKIQDLPVYPLSYHKDKTSIYENAISRGKKFVGITRQLFETSGPACVEGSSFGKTDVFKSNVSIITYPSAFIVIKQNLYLRLMDA